MFHPYLCLCLDWPAVCFLSLLNTHNTNIDAPRRDPNSQPQQTIDRRPTDLKPLGHWDRRIRSTDRPAHSESLYSRSYLVPATKVHTFQNDGNKVTGNTLCLLGYKSPVRSWIYGPDIFSSTSNRDRLSSCWLLSSCQMKLIAVTIWQKQQETKGLQERIWVEWRS